jgi:hypothetical protein
VAVGFGVDAAGDVRERVAHEHARGAAGELDHLDAALDFGAGFGERFAMFAGDQGGELFKVLKEEVAVFEEDTGALDGRGVCPGDEGPSLATAAVSAPAKGTRAITDLSRVEYWSRGEAPTSTSADEGGYGFGGSDGGHGVILSVDLRAAIEIRARRYHITRGKCPNRAAENARGCHFTHRPRALIQATL